MHFCLRGCNRSIMRKNIEQKEGRIGMKKIAAVLLALFALTVLTSCYGKEDEHIDFSSLIPMSTRSVLVEYTSGGKTISYTAEKQVVEELENWLSGLKCERRNFEHGSTPADCDGGECYTFTTDKASFSYVINGKDECYLNIKDGWYFVKNPTNPPEFDGGETTALNEEQTVKARAVFVRDRLYISTETESTIEGRCGNMDGEIISSVPEDEMPSKNGESNFGTGYSYQVTGVNTVDVFIGDKIIVFRCFDNEGELWVSRADEKNAVKLSKVHEVRIKLLLAEAEWQPGAANCIFDCLIGGTENGNVYYHSDCGTLSREETGEYSVLSETDKELLNGILEQYIILGF